MTSVTCTNFRANLSQYLDAVSQNREPITITRRDKSDVVIIDAEEYVRMTEIICRIRSIDD